MEQWIGILSFDMGNMNSLSRFKRLDLIRHVLSPAAEGNKAYPLLVERGELGISRKLGVKCEGWFDASMTQQALANPCKYIADAIGQRIITIIRL